MMQPLIDQHGEQIGVVDFAQGCFHRPKFIARPRESWVCFQCRQPIHKGEAHYQINFEIVPGDVHSIIPVRECLTCHAAHQPVLQPATSEPDFYATYQAILAARAKPLLRQAQAVMKVSDNNIDAICEEIHCARPDILLRLLDIPGLGDQDDFWTPLLTAVTGPQGQQMKMDFCSAIREAAEPDRVCRNLPPLPPPINPYAFRQALRSCWPPLHLGRDYSLSVTQGRPEHFQFTLRRHVRRDATPEDLLPKATLYCHAIAAFCQCAVIIADVVDDDQFVAVFQ
jgi:hypothetical protein